MYLYIPERQPLLSLQQNQNILKNKMKRQCIKIPTKTKKIQHQQQKWNCNVFFFINFFGKTSTWADDQLFGKRHLAECRMLSWTDNSLSIVSSCGTKPIPFFVVCVCVYMGVCMMINCSSMLFFYILLSFFWGGFGNKKRQDVGFIFHLTALNLVSLPGFPLINNWPPHFFTLPISVF